jgi:hypothetical protein
MTLWAIWGFSVGNLCMLRRCMTITLSPPLITILILTLLPPHVVPSSVPRRTCCPCRWVTG